MVPPGFSQPAFSAASIIDRAMRSLMEPPGFWLSSFRNRRHGPVSIRVTSTIGVLPIRSSRDFAGRLRTGASVIDMRAGSVARVTCEAGRPRLCGQLLQVFTLSRSEEHTSELQSRENLVCRLLLEKKKDAH